MAIVKINKQRYWSIFMLEEEDLLLVRRAGEAIMSRQEAVFEEFYAWLEFQPEYSADYTEEIIERFDQQSAIFWKHILSAQVDEESVHYRERLVQDLLKLGLPFEAYLSATFAFHELIEKAFVQEGVASFELMQAFKKVSSVGVFIAIDTFNNEMNKQLQEQNDMLMQLSTPVTPIWEQILLLPVVGIVDSFRAQNIMTAVLQEIADYQAKVFILDISGVGVVDTAVANYFIKVSKAANLMGCECIISGVTPAVAQTLVELGIDIENIQTNVNIKEALKTAIGQI
ncbi:STAS domain-containing protein [Saprospira grandis]|uniref:Anti-anti-sigma regulatory factor n=1 Tax=Saprospira grandis (strain Lewin) TaxID=984262 RepID=H6L363_SAPGL|nr:STAS domain-containing protein [Saprospira grandis]AFC24890.1 anti-anti-sigma regulatory factor [Saprospira grandis str. Lewin]